MFSPKRTKGFTLIELLVVIAIIGLLSSVVLASLSTARAKARDAHRMADIKNITLALEMYYDTKQAYPVSTSTNIDAQGWVRSDNKTNWDWFIKELEPYLNGKALPPVNVWPFPYYYRTSTHGYGIDSLCRFTTPSSEGQTYLMLFGVESQTYNLPILDINNGGSKERYCIRP